MTNIFFTEFQIIYGDTYPPRRWNLILVPSLHPPIKNELDDVFQIGKEKMVNLRWMFLANITLTKWRRSTSPACHHHGIMMPCGHHRSLIRCDVKATYLCSILLPTQNPRLIMRKTADTSIFRDK